MIELIGDKDPKVREGAISALAVMDAVEKNTVVILTSLQRDTEAKVRSAAALALGKGKTEKVGQALLVALRKEQEGSVRAMVALALSNFYLEGMVQALLATLKDDEYAFARYNAAFALGELGAKEAQKGLVQVLEKEADPLVRLAIETALQKIRE